MERSPKKTTFWSIAKSTFESQLRKNVAKMKLLGPEKMMDDLMYYNIEYWCKTTICECFNSWILAARHKTIITMLDEIRVKMMTRIAKLREFTNTWMCDFSDVFEERRKAVRVKIGKLPRTGLAMTCSSCNVRGHNKRGCPQRVESSIREEPSNIDKEMAKLRFKADQRSKGRPLRHLVHLQGLQRSRGRPPAAPSASPGLEVGGRPFGEHSASAATYKRCKRKTTYCTATPNASQHRKDAPPTCPSPANYHVGIGVFQDENGFKAFNPGMSSCKIFSTGTTKVTKSADVTGDIGYKPSTAPKLKWNGKAAISTRKLQEMREEQRKKSKGSSSNNPI
ncbi:hypothetical protein H5410_007733 [Solanum commersonii]|uniref:Uncharacterized protein n=1 Tax=Solanum commersonii TaxID=4109 RepID=A0A9J6ADT4_SOLCO|nr:hypothetical protein H5410_007733 [Solanum commersonii]